MAPAGTGIPAKRARRAANGAYADATGNAGRGARIVTSRWALIIIFGNERHSGAMPTGPAYGRPDDRLSIKPGIPRFQVWSCRTIPE
jgi:hypothetical protein